MSSAFLAKLKAALRPGGMALFNVAARSQALYEKACNALRTEFDQVSRWSLKVHVLHLNGNRRPIRCNSPVLNQ